MKAVYNLNENFLFSKRTENKAIKKKVFRVLFIFMQFVKLKLREKS